MAVNTKPLAMSLTLTLDSWDSPVPVQVDLRYDPSDPYAVQAVFDIGTDEPVHWVFARDLLDEGLVGEAGSGDVITSPARDGEGRLCLRLELRSPDGSAVLLADAENVLRFLGITYQLVPAGTESDHLDLDPVIATLLDAA